MIHEMPPSHFVDLRLVKTNLDKEGLKFQNTRVRISKHVCLEINSQNNAVLEQMFINFQDYDNHSF